MKALDHIDRKNIEVAHRRKQNVKLSAQLQQIRAQLALVEDERDDLKDAVMQLIEKGRLQVK